MHQIILKYIYIIERFYYYVYYYVLLLCLL